MKFAILFVCCVMASIALAGPPGHRPLPNPSLKGFSKNFPSNPTRTRDEFIVGGVAAVPGQIPFQVAVMPSGFLCGGSILSVNWIITAAHCVVSRAPEDITIRYDTISVNSGGLTVGVAAVMVHPSYDSVSHNNDIALLQTAFPLTFSNNVKPVALTTSGNDPIPNSYLQVSGFGRLSSGGILADTLRVVRVATVDRTICNAYYGGILTGSMFCAASPGKDSCQGDSGGPVIDSSNKLVGIVSFGIGCGDTDIPGVYTRVGVFVNWIYNVVNMVNR